MNAFKKMLAMILALCLIWGLAASASASTFTDAHGNVIELDEDRKSTRLNSSHGAKSRMPSSA